MMPNATTARQAASARLAAALGVSLALHYAALATLSQLPRGSQAGNGSLSDGGTGRLHAALRTTAPGVDSRQSEEQVMPPAPPAVSAPEPALEPALESEVEPGAGILAAPFYYPASQLDERPRIMADVDPEFPRGAQASAGRVVLRLYIGEHGEVERVAVVEPEPPDAFGKSALDAFAAARFTPGVRNGVPVRSLMTIEVLFSAQTPRTTAPRY
jgi:TonB family protein